MRYVLVKENGERGGSYASKAAASRAKNRVNQNADRNETIPYAMPITRISGIEAVES